MSTLPYEIDTIPVTDPEHDAPDGTQRNLGPVTLERHGDTWSPVHRCDAPSLRSLWLPPGRYYRCVAPPGHREHSAVVDSGTGPSGYAIIRWWGIGEDQVEQRISDVDWNGSPVSR